jgi:hypothetical protein
MTNDDIIRMARKAGLCDSSGEDDDSVNIVDHLERFAGLVAAAERERIKAANAPVIENINKHLDEMRAAIRARGNT